MSFPIDDYAVRILAFDSCVPGEHYGQVDRATLDLLRSALKDQPTKPSVIAMHHPLFCCGIPYLDKYRCLETEVLEALVSEFANVQAVACGHVPALLLVRLPFKE